LILEIRLKKKILFVDDEVFMREMWHLILSDEGYEVLTAATAEECLEVAGKENPDLIISDILMPQTDGLTLCDKIRKNDSLCDIPIILITGVFKDLEFRSRVDQSTADAFMLKPLDKEKLLSTINELL
jgi:CheY-like chemotaxis protein